MYIYIYIYIYTIYTYTYIHLYTYILLDSYRRSLFVILHKCAHRVKNNNVSLARLLLKSFLDFTKCQCLQLFPVSLDKKSLASKESKSSTIFGYFFCRWLRVLSIWWRAIVCGSSDFSMIPGAPYVASLWYYFAIFTLWFLWNVMATLL